MIKRTITFFLLLLMVVFGLSGCSSKDDLVEENGEVLSEREVVDTLEDAGLLLERTSAKSPLEDELNINPIVYNLNGTDDKIFIYVFNYTADRKEVFPESQASAEGNSQIFTGKNTAIVLQSTEESEYYFDFYTKIGEEVFSGMHDIKNVIFEGEGSLFNIVLNINYYEYEWNDREGNVNIESEGRTSSKITYKGENYEETSELVLIYSWEEDGEELSRERRVYSSSLFNKDGFYKMPPSSASETFPREGDTINLTVKTNGVEENFQLTGQPASL